LNIGPSWGGWQRFVFIAQVERSRLVLVPPRVPTDIRRPRNATASHRLSPEGQPLVIPRVSHFQRPYDRAFH
jgi:hypothetical protein